MFNARNLTRLFFLLALCTSLVAGVKHGRAQAGVADDAECADGNRRLCLTVPLQGGGTAYFYWV
jgi:hypothetical protein